MTPISLIAATKIYNKILGKHDELFSEFNDWLFTKGMPHNPNSFLVIFNKHVEMSITPFYIDGLVGKVEFNLLESLDGTDKKSKSLLFNVFINSEGEYGFASSNESRIDFSDEFDEHERDIFMPVLKAFFTHYKIETR
ncbi:hypothetical protein ACROAH_14795 [Shewanella oncorhynchi]|uniref:hypothetical protein n=1 Tax=Shewanella TaxID=22 RepID=UPI0021D880B6|nr:hypothetical protein [Shewanella sp. SM103]MCU8078434.1 hypothetical protein [Shewanella sp. SM103]